MHTRPHPRHRSHASAILALLAAASPLAAGGTTAPPPPQQPELSPWEQFNDWNIGGILFPSLHLHGVGGWSTGSPEELASGGHDPSREAFSMQALEPGMSLRTRYLEGFANYLAFQDADGDWDGELEEAFGKLVNIPGGFELKGGQFLSRFGALNDKHLHAWDFVDSETVLSRFLGDDGLLLRGAELSWTIPLGLDPVFTTVASVGYGDTRPHDHSHGGEGHDEHGHEALYDAEEAGFDNGVWTARLMGRYRFNDFHTLTGGFSSANGQNGWDMDSRVVGFDLEYLWRENGLESGGRAFRWRNEFLWRRVEAGGSSELGHEDHDDHAPAHDDHHDEHHAQEDHGDDSHEEDAEAHADATRAEEIGLYTHLIYSWNEHLDTSLRVGWVEGIDEFGLDERLRISPGVSWWLDKQRRVGLRAQYNYDRLPDSEEEHSLWLQVSVALGDTNEVR